MATGQAWISLRIKFHSELMYSMLSTSKRQTFTDQGNKTGQLQNTGPLTVSNAPINVKPGWGKRREPQAYVGIWHLLPSPPSGIWLRIWVPGWGSLLSFAQRNWTKSHHPMCLSVRSSAHEHFFLYLYKNTMYFSLLIFNINWRSTLRGGDWVDCW